ncbi:YncE family protein [Pelagerythrobacter sp.]|uniref:YncE family protein n=1 Tax=Pelagerythrobacter sp. TaxID=2800702 RepID=UPI0035B16DBD
MRITRSSSAAVLMGLMLAASPIAVGSAAAQQAFGEVAKAADASVSFDSAEDGAPIVAGSQVEVSGSGFQPGQQVTLAYGPTTLTAQPLTADTEGAVTGAFALPADAVVGVHPIVVTTGAPYYATIAELKVSPDIPLSGEDAFDLTVSEPARGLYQTVYSPKSGAIYAASAVGRPPVKQSEIVKLDADTLKVLARVSPAAAPQRQGRDGTMGDGGLFAVYGIAVDDSKDTVWVTNTRQDTVAVYRQSDLGLIKQFAPGTVAHSRDVRVDEELGKAYATATFTPEVVVFNTADNTEAKRITIASNKRREEFGVASLSLDPEAHKLYVAGLGTSEVAVIDTNTDEVLHVFPVPGARGTIGVSHDPQTGRIYVASQGSDNLVVLDGETGAVIADTPVGAGALNVVFDPASRQAFVANRGSNTVTVTDADGKIVANLGPAPRANHVALGPNGSVIAVDKSAGTRDAESDQLLRIVPAN